MGAGHLSLGLPPSLSASVHLTAMNLPNIAPSALADTTVTETRYNSGGGGVPSPKLLSISLTECQKKARDLRILKMRDLEITQVSVNYS